MSKTNRPTLKFKMTPKWHQSNLWIPFELMLQRYSTLWHVHRIQLFSLYLPWKLKRISKSILSLINELNNYTSGDRHFKMAVVQQHTSRSFQKVTCCGRNSVAIVIPTICSSSQLTSTLIHTQPLQSQQSDESASVNRVTRLQRLLIADTHATRATWNFFHSPD